MISTAKVLKLAISYALWEGKPNAENKSSKPLSRTLDFVSTDAGRCSMLAIPATCYVI
jgi:hypothetical protein